MVTPDKITETDLDLFDPRTKAIPVFELIDVDMDMGDGVYGELLNHFRRHYNFLLARVGKEPLPSSFSTRKLL